MNLETLVQWSGILAIVTGIIAIAMMWMTEEMQSKYPALEWIYVATAIFSLFAFMGIYLFMLEDSGIVGLLGFVLAIIGNAFFMSNGRIAGIDAYTLASSIFAGGLIFLAIGALISQGYPIWIPILWLTSPILGLPAIYVKSLQGLMYKLAAVVYGAATIGAGFTLLTQ
jgi:hypothetical protein